MEGTKIGMMEPFESKLTRAENQLLATLDSPVKIQGFLDDTPYSADKFYRCPLRVLREQRAHCFDGALFAAMALRRLGIPPRIVELIPNARDDDHLVAVFQVHGRWGAIAQSNFSGLRYREPVYKSVRELAMSYFEHFFNHVGEKTLRGCRGPVDLTVFDDLDWMASDGGLEELSDRLDGYHIRPLISESMAARLSAVDERSLRAGMLGTDPEGLYQVRK